MKRTQKLVTWGIVILVILVVLLMLVSNLRRSSRVVLPDISTAAEDPELPSGENGLTVVEVTPETVQAAVATLHRPEAYSRSVTVEYLWDGGSKTAEMTVSVSGPWSRTDRTLPDGQVRHTVTDGETTYIWYNDENEFFSGPAGNVTPDMEQAIPTYEDVLSLPVEEIAQAD